MHRSVLVAAWLGSACTTVHGPERAHEIRAHFLPACTPSDTEETEFALEALGDFAPSPQTSEALGTDGRTTLVVPADTRAVTVHATNGFDEFEGAASPNPDDSIDVSLWPEGAACRLFSSDPRTYPGALGGQAVGVSADSRVLLVAGGNGENPIATGALTVDLNTGEAGRVPSDFGPRERRSSATVTPFGGDLLVAGGSGSEGGAALASAEIFDVGTRHFEPDVVALQMARTEHAAVVLPSGETLLIGGVDARGTPQKTLEAVSPSSRRYRISDLTELGTPRVNPVAVRLSDDRVLVAGGFSDAAKTRPVASLEWLTADASAVDAVLSNLPDDPGGVVTGRAFIAMPGGSALAVGGCEGGAEGRVCVAPSRDAYWVTREGVAVRLPDLDVTASPATLVAGDEGRPWLVATNADGARTLARFDPWTGRFDTPPAPIPPLGPLVQFFSAAPGLFGWLALDEDGAPFIAGFRHGTRGPFVKSVAPLLLAGDDGVSLDRPLQSDAGGAPDPVTGATATRAPRGGVSLGGPTTLWITDATYANFRLSVTVTGGAPPSVLVGSSRVGGPYCPFPAVKQAPDPTSVVVVAVRREGSALTLGAGEATTDCAGPPGRVSIGLTASTGVVTIKAVSISRDASP